MTRVWAKLTTKSLNQMLADEKEQKISSENTQSALKMLYY